MRTLIRSKKRRRRKRKMRRGIDTLLYIPATLSEMLMSKTDVSYDLDQSLYFTRPGR